MSLSSVSSRRLFELLLLQFQRSLVITPRWRPSIRLISECLYLMSCMTMVESKEPVATM